jgi:imidazolonepropionase-like amidohydrolase
MALEAGVKIAMGTDAGYTPVPHGTNAFELELMVRYGMSALDAILVSTRDAARALRMEDTLGTIEKGKLADIIVIDGDPLEDISVLQEKEKISLVMKEGAIYLNRLWEAVRE